jgi:hypothetical protein
VQADGRPQRQPDDNDRRRQDADTSWEGVAVKQDLSTLRDGHRQSGQANAVLYHLTSHPAQNARIIKT